MLDKIDRKLLFVLQQDCTKPLQALAEAVNLTSTPCWKRIKRLDDEGYISSRVALLDKEKLGLGLTVFMMIKTKQHSSEWCRAFFQITAHMPEVLSFYRISGKYDYLMQLEMTDMQSYNIFYKRLVNSVPNLTEVTSSLVMEKIKQTTALPVPE